MPAQQYLDARDLARQQHESMDHYSRQVYDAAVQSTVDPATGLVDLRKLRDASGKDAYEKAFIDKGVEVADILAQTTGTGAISFNPAIMDNFDKARALLTIGLNLEKVHNTVERLGENANANTMERTFYHDVEEVKKIFTYGAGLELDMTNPNEVPGVVNYLNATPRRASRAGVRIDPAKVKSKDDLVAILDEFDDRGVLTPDWKDRMLRSNRDIFR